MTRSTVRANGPKEAETYLVWFSPPPPYLSISVAFTCILSVELCFCLSISSARAHARGHTRSLAQAPSSHGGGGGSRAACQSARSVTSFHLQKGSGAGLLLFQVPQSSRSKTTGIYPQFMIYAASSEVLLYGAFAFYFAVWLRDFYASQGTFTVRL